MKKKKEPQKVNVIYQFEKDEPTKEECEQFAFDFACLLMKWDKRKVKSSSVALGCQKLEP